MSGENSGVVERINERQRRIILVGAADHLTEQVADALVGSGFAVSTVESARECLGQIEATDIDGIVSTYELPELDGLHLLRSVRVVHPSLPFILHPQEGSEQLAGESIAAGVSGYVPNDADPKIVISRLRNSSQEEESLLDNESHNRYRHLIDISPAPINLFDSEGAIIWGNNAVIELLGLESREALIGRSIFEFIHPDDADNAREELESVIAQKMPTGPTPMKLSPPDKDDRYIQVATAIGEFLGTDIGQAVIVDVTEHKEREHQLEILDTWLRHNIRNGMTLIHSLADEIERGKTDDIADSARQIQDYAETLVEQADRERKLINLIISHPEPAVLNARQVVTQAVRTSSDEFPSSDIRLTRVDDIAIKAIPKLLEAIKELIANGVKHNESNPPTVEVQVVQTADKKAKIRIADNGPGIPDVELEPLSPDGNINQLHHGSGLGLVFSSWVVRLSGGDILFNEDESGETVVSLILPVVDE